MARGLGLPALRPAVKSGLRCSSGCHRSEHDSSLRTVGHPEQIPTKPIAAGYLHYVGSHGHSAPVQRPDGRLLRLFTSPQSRPQPWPPTLPCGHLAIPATGGETETSAIWGAPSAWAFRRGDPAARRAERGVARGEAVSWMRLSSDCQAVAKDVTPCSCRRRPSPPTSTPSAFESRDQLLVDAVDPGRESRRASRPAAFCRDRAVVGEGEQGLLGHRVDRERRRQRLDVEDVGRLLVLGAGAGPQEPLRSGRPR